MPLVIPGITTAEGGNDKTTEWSNKLVGKKLSDTEPTNEVTFCKKDLPEVCRVIKPGQMVTRDFRENRLNVHLMEDGTVSHVAHG